VRKQNSHDDHWRLSEAITGDGSSVKDRSTEADARIIIDNQLRQAGWDPTDKSQVLTEVTVHEMRHHVAEPHAAY
jgi:type I site-specific restriction endonuclease